LIHLPESEDLEEACDCVCPPVWHKWRRADRNCHTRLVLLLGTRPELQCLHDDSACTRMCPIKKQYQCQHLIAHQWYSVRSI